MLKDDTNPDFTKIVQELMTSLDDPKPEPPVMGRYAKAQEIAKRTSPNNQMEAIAAMMAMTEDDFSKLYYTTQFVVPVDNELPPTTIWDAIRRILAKCLR